MGAPPGNVRLLCLGRPDSTGLYIETVELVNPSRVGDGGSQHVLKACFWAWRNPKP